jgi:glycosyltransferase involved in cell wall biosynthesis
MSKKRKILLLSDDMRLPSGVGGVSKDIVLGTVDMFDWAQLGAAINHPDKGKVFDLSEDAKKSTGIDDAYVKLYPWAGYGDQMVLRQLIDLERPDAILHFTDPRFWTWLYQMERELRNYYKIPILYYNIWDDGPDPDYNADFYASCDALYSISKQTFGINVRTMLRKYAERVELVDDTNNPVDTSDINLSEDMWSITNRSETQLADLPRVDARKVKVAYIPHGIPTNTFKPLESDDEKLVEMKSKIFGNRNPEFVLFYNSRNIRRKMTSDVIYSFNEFLMGLPKEKRDKVFLILHTQRVDNNGTDLPAVINKLVDSKYQSQIFINEERLSDENMNLLYNLVDTTIGIASNEGFGLSTAESIAAGTPIIVNVTGGLQDQCGFRWKDNGELLTEWDYVKIGSLHDKRKWKDKVTWGEWVAPVWPSAMNVVGSPPTPYIIDDRVDNYDVVEAINQMYNLADEERKQRGLAGREWLSAEGKLNLNKMTELFRINISNDINKFQPRENFEVIAL